MKILLKNVKIIAKNSPYHGQVQDILIENGIISEITSVINDQADTVIEGDAIHVSEGWFDMRVHNTSPGLEFKEDLCSLTNAAHKGGITGFLLLPNSQPCIQSKEAIHYLKRYASQKSIDIFPTGAVTTNTEGKDFTEMIDLHKAGAKAFTDGIHPIQNGDVFLKTILYLSQINALLINKPEEKHLAHSGQMNEGIYSTLLGLKGIPNLAEEMMILRDLKLLEYAFGKKTENKRTSILHFSGISTEEGVKLIREAKKKGLLVSCDVSVHQLIFGEEDLMTFDTNLKVSPPFRTQKDKNALWEGLQDGTIDVLVSDHNPQEEESKKVAFDVANPGIIGIETLFLAMNTYNKKIKLEDWIEKITRNPRTILELPQPEIDKGKVANITLFSLSKTKIYQEKDIVSKSKNSPFIGKELQGEILGIVHKGRWIDNRNKE